ncbi:MAG: carboxymuconolactone decarboxylase family protein [Pseudonocardiales bacterium]|nr:MAG: carboxymuconolactone decarboxylase family protein [Pseudonocardiales bacterium]
MARISLDPPRTLTYRIGAWYSRRKYGTLLEPGIAVGHNPRVMRTYAKEEMSLARWNRLPADLQHLAVLAAATHVGCSWCMDFGYWVTTTEGLDPAKVRDVPRWRDSAVYTELERRVMAFAEAASATPPEVTDEMVDGLRADLDDAQLVELAMMVAVENQRSRFNIALGLTSQGFKDRCEPAYD